MKKRMHIIVLTAALCGSMFLSGCSFSSVVGRLLDRGKKEADNVISSDDSGKEQAKIIDDSLNKPGFENDLTGSLAVAQGTPLQLETGASVNDGGTVTYQWYRNNVNANGGGTLIAGATDTVYTVDTSEADTAFYYVVATNTIGEAINMSVSGTYQVTVWPAGEWKETDNGTQYVMEDGTFPVDTRLLIDGTIFMIDTEGYRTDEGQAAPETMKGDTADAAVLQAAAEEAAAAKAAEEEAKKAEEEKKA
ncbi:MAG: hypothetical protein IJ860_03570 [Eubacterium sp.]|nr:hypothetical protein [Eubacterium sp.]